MKTRNNRFIPVLKNQHEKKVIACFLAGDMTSREAGEKMDMTHQGLINLVCSLTRKWYQDHKIKEVY
ncbi:hypothetical protein IID22_02070 [Patescibacteria group bacterium]|nr:hypothetical protein [Patescibacteria group bacterium]